MSTPERRPNLEIVSAEAASSTGRADPLPIWVTALDKVLSVQRPVVVAHLRSIRRRHPEATNEQMLRTLERRYLSAVTAGGAAVGTTAAIPVVGTGTAIALAGAETVGFLESSALFAQSVAEVHGLLVSDPDRARALVITMMLGSSGKDILRQFSGELMKTARPRSAFWGEMITANLPQAAVGPVADELTRRFLKKFVTTKGGTLLGKVVPFGIGAVIGGVGNHLAGREVVRSARSAFGPAPLVLPAEFEPR
ncbi:hypothetical protein [Paramicrobacterium agarici]|uniref:EcsC family protein n=1 Tax=Paramicrobacterium agarici TaxID=630514 RepID=A0A2A9E0B4_9MICO|nr:hypothetical protein [Microbacterium agarici]PFG31629.1 hypothetical protein ATJ78_2606 [Microbacterium agarici]